MSDTLTTQQTDRKDIRSTIETMKGQFALALPKLLTPERFVRVALTCVNKNPKLLLCTRDSLLACLLDCAQLGIEPDGRRAHLIPFEDRRNNRVICTLIIDYKGLAELVRRSGEVATLHAGIVYPSDKFDYAFGTGQFLNHKPNLDRGDEKPIAVYSYVKLKDGQEDFDVMGISEVNKVRARSRASNAGPWVTDFDEMAKKSIFRRHSKWLPLSPELREKIEKDDVPLTQQERFAAAKQIGETPETGMQFGPALPQETTVQGAIEPEPETHGPTTDQPNDPAATPRRKRRTKAEMEADRAAEASAGQPPAPAAPPLATPLQGLRNLIAASPIKEEELLQRCKDNGYIMADVANFGDLPDDVIVSVTSSFMSLAEEILDKGRLPA